MIIHQDIIIVQNVTKIKEKIEMTFQKQIIVPPPPLPVPIPNYGTIYNLDTCCGTEASALNKLIAQYYMVASPMMFKNNDNIFAAEIFGKEVEKLYNAQNDLNYLLCLFVMIYNERLNDEQWSNNGEDKGTQYYYDEHNLKCIRQSFMCKGYDILPLLKVFGLDTNITISQTIEPIGTSPIGVLSIG